MEVDFATKITNMLKIPAIFQSPGRVSGQGKNEISVMPENGENDIKNFPAGRIRSDEKIGKDGRILSANMTGQVALSGSFADLNFNRGSLKRIKKDDNILLDRMDSRARFLTATENIGLKNESAFSFDSDTEYGLRTVQTSENKNYYCRIITDFTFSRKSEDAFIFFTVNYPDLKHDKTVIEASVFEFRLFNNAGITISSEEKSTKNLTIFPDDKFNLSIPGYSFEINTGKLLLKLSYLKEYGTARFSEINNLAVKTAAFHGKKILLINPGGSYTPAPAEYYSGVQERFCIKLYLKQI